MLASEVMNKNFVFCTEDATLEQVFELMTQNNCDCVFVVESRAHFIPIGTITTRDICRQIVGKGRNPRGMYAGSVMNTKIVKTTEKTELEKCRSLLKSKSAERVCVLDKDGKLCGTLTISEIEKAEEVKPQVENMVNRKTVQIYNAPGVNRIF